MSSWLRLTASVAKLPSRFRLTLKFSSKPFFQTYKYCQNSSHTSLFRRQYQQHACRTVSHICRTFTVQRQSRLKSIRYASQGSRKAHHTSFLTTSVSRRQLSLQSEQGDLWKNSPFQSKVLNALGVEKYTDEELHEVFENLAYDDNTDKRTARLYKYEVSNKFHKVLDGITVDKKEIDDLVDKFWNHDTFEKARGASNDIMSGENGEVESVTEEQFTKRVRDLAQSLDNRMMPLAAIFLASGISIGVMIPIMPQLAQLMSLSTAQYGSIVGAFALTKMIGNVPAAMAVERFGCKNVLAASMIALGFGIGAIGMVNSYEGLIMCRLAGGACVAGFVSAAYVYLADISNPLNRGSTIAPPSTAFTAGTALGPAIGGGLHAFLNLQQTFYAAGAGIFLIGAITSMSLRAPAVLKTQSELHEEAKAVLDSKSNEFDASTSNEGAKMLRKKEKKGVIDQWRELLSNKGISSMTGLNFGYWLVLSGVNMTLLPMILVDPAFGLSPVEVGGVFAGISVVGVFCTPLAGRLVDRVGRMETALPAAVVLASAMCASVFTSDLSQLLGLLGVWTVAGSFLSTAPTAYISDVTTSKDRPQALALLRTAGDIGMLGGSVIAGLIANVSSNLQAIQINGGAMLVIAGITGFNVWSANREQRPTR